MNNFPSITVEHTFYLMHHLVTIYTQDTYIRTHISIHEHVCDYQILKSGCSSGDH